MLRGRKPTHTIHDPKQQLLHEKSEEQEENARLMVIVNEILRINIESPPAFRRPDNKMRAGT